MDPKGLEVASPWALTCGAMAGVVLRIIRAKKKPKKRKK